MPLTNFILIQVATHSIWKSSLKEIICEAFLDPLTESADTWVEIQPSNEEEEGIYDIRTGYTGKAKDGTYYEEW